MTTDPATAKRHVVNTLVAQTNEYQGEWTSRGSLYTGVVAHGPLTPNEAEATTAELVEEGDIEHDDGEYRLADGVDRIPHPGET